MTKLEQLLDDQLSTFRALIAEGKGEYGRAGYVLDETWHSWHTVLRVLETIKRKADEE